MDARLLLLQLGCFGQAYCRFSEPCFRCAFLTFMQHLEVALSWMDSRSIFSGGRPQRVLCRHQNSGSEVRIAS